MVMITEDRLKKLNIHEIRDLHFFGKGFPIQLYQYSDPVTRKMKHRSLYIIKYII